MPCGRHARPASPSRVISFLNGRRCAHLRRRPGTCRSPGAARSLVPARRPAAASVTLTFGMIRLIIMGSIVAGGWMSRLPASIDYARRPGPVKPSLAPTLPSTRDIPCERAAGHERPASPGRRRMGACETTPATTRHRGNQPASSAHANRRRLFLAPDHRPPLAGLKLVRPRLRLPARRCGRCSLTPVRARRHKPAAMRKATTTVPPQPRRPANRSPGQSSTAS